MSEWSARSTSASPGVWDQEVAAGAAVSRLVVASHLASARWCEVEIHHVDLGLGYRAADWSDELVDRMLPRMLKALPSRCDRRDLLGWTLGSRRRPLTRPLELNRIGPPLTSSSRALSPGSADRTRRISRIDNGGATRRLSTTPNVAQYRVREHPGVGCSGVLGWQPGRSWTGCTHERERCGRASGTHPVTRPSVPTVVGGRCASDDLPIPFCDLVAALDFINA